MGVKEFSQPGNISISLQEIAQQLPQTVMHNIGNSVTLYTDRVQWIYKEEYLMLRIPLSEGNESWMYAVKPYNNPNGGVHVYKVNFYPTNYSNDSSFSGRQMWVNFQDWKVYGVRFENGVAINSLTPVKFADPGWEKCAMKNNLFSLNGENEIIVNEDPRGLKAPQPLGGPLDCPEWGTGGFFKRLGAFFRGIGEVIKDIGGLLNDVGGGENGGNNGDNQGSADYYSPALLGCL